MGQQTHNFSRGSAVRSKQVNISRVWRVCNFTWGNAITSYSGRMDWREVDSVVSIWWGCWSIFCEGVLRIFFGYLNHGDTYCATPDHATISRRVHILCAMFFRESQRFCRHHHPHHVGRVEIVKSYLASLSRGSVASESLRCRYSQRGQRLKSLLHELWITNYFSACCVFGQLI